MSLNIKDLAKAIRAGIPGAYVTFEKRAVGEQVYYGVNVDYGEVGGATVSTGFNLTQEEIDLWSEANTERLLDLLEKQRPLT